MFGWFHIIWITLVRQIVNFEPLFKKPSETWVSIEKFCSFIMWRDPWNIVTHSVNEWLLCFKSSTLCVREDEFTMNESLILRCISNKNTGRHVCVQNLLIIPTCKAQWLSMLYRVTMYISGRSHNLKIQQTLGKVNNLSLCWISTYLYF